MQTVHIKGMTCDSCARHVDSALREAGEQWIGEREGDDAFLLTVDEAFHLGELWNRHRLGVTADV